MNEVKFKANIKDLAALQAAVSEIPEIPAPATTDEGKVLTVAVDSSGETPVAEYELAAPASGLPAIASGDAGKVLTVNAGETAAEWASPSGGNNTFIVTYTYDDSTRTCTADKTYQEIVAAITAGKTIIAKDVFTGYTLPLATYNSADMTIGFSITELYGLTETAPGSGTGTISYSYDYIMHGYNDYDEPDPFEFINYESGGGTISVSNAYAYKNASA